MKRVFIIHGWGGYPEEGTSKNRSCLSKNIKKAQAARRNRVRGGKFNEE